MAELGNVSFKVEAITSGFDKLVRELQNLNSSITKTNQLLERHARQNRAITNATEATSRAVNSMKRSMDAASTSQAQAAASTSQLTQQTMASATAQQKVAVSANKAAESANKVAAANTKSARATKIAGMETEKFTKRMTDLSKSIQIALGPLSGIAARVTAFASLANRTVVAVAGAISAFIALSAVMLKAIKVGSGFESQLRAVESVLLATGRQSETTAAQLEAVAEEFGHATLSTKTAGLQALISLQQFRRIGPEMQKSALLAAQGLSQIGRGGLATQIRRIGRVLNDPISNLDALREAGVEFTEVEKEKISNLQRSGKLLEAQGVIMQRLAGAEAAATGATKGLAGAIDSLNEDITKWFDEIGRASGAVELLTKYIKEVDAALIKVGTEFNTAQVIGNSLRAIIDALGAAVVALIRNFDLLVTAINILISLKFASIITRIGMKVIIWTKSIQGLTVATKFATVAQRGFNLAIKRFPLLFIAGAIATVLELLLKFKKRTDEIKTFSMERVKTEIGSAKKEVARIKQEIQDLNTPKKTSDGKSTTVGSRGLSGRSKLIALNRELKNAQDDLNKLLERQLEIEEDIARAKREAIAAAGGQRMIDLRAMGDEAVDVSKKIDTFAADFKKASAEADNLYNILNLSAKEFAVIADHTGMTRNEFMRTLALVEQFGTQADRTRTAISQQTQDLVAQRNIEKSLGGLKAQRMLTEEQINAAISAGIIRTREEFVAVGTLTEEQIRQLNVLKEIVATREKAKKELFATTKSVEIKESIDLMQREKELLLVSSELRRDELEMFQFKLDLQKQGIDINSTLFDQLVAQQKQLQQQRAQLEDLQKLTGILTDGMTRGADAFVDALMSGADAGDAVKAVMREIVAELIKAIVKAVFLRSIMNSIGGLFGGTPGAGGIFGNLLGLGSSPAGGGNLNSQMLQVGTPGGGPVSSLPPTRFADGGIVKGPTFFGMGGKKRGMMGEAGPEAILPLVRGANGKLGVGSSGGGGGNNTQILIDVRGSNGDEAIEAAVRRGIKAAAPGLIQASVSRVQGDSMRNPQFLRNK